MRFRGLAGSRGLQCDYVYIYIHTHVHIEARDYGLAEASLESYIDCFACMFRTVPWFLQCLLGG